MLSFAGTVIIFKGAGAGLCQIPAPSTLANDTMLWTFLRYR